MIRSVVSKAMWVGRTTAAVIGLAVALAVVFGVATMALAAVPGDPFQLGQLNTINRVSTLVGNTTGPMLRVENKGAGPAANLKVQAGKPPMAVNSTGRIPKLNADMVDGKHAGAFVQKGAVGVPIAGANIASTGAVRSHFNRVGGAPTVDKINTGLYIVTFPGLEGEVAHNNAIALISSQGAGETSRGTSATGDAVVATYNSSGISADRAFDIVVVKSGGS